MKKILWWAALISALSIDAIAENNIHKLVHDVLQTCNSNISKNKKVNISNGEPFYKCWKNNKDICINLMDKKATVDADFRNWKVLSSQYFTDYFDKNPTASYVAKILNEKIPFNKLP